MTKEGRTLPITCKPSSKIGAPTPVGKVRPVLTVVPGAADADDTRRPGGMALIDEIVRSFSPCDRCPCSSGQRRARTGQGGAAYSEPEPARGWGPALSL